MNKKIDKFVEKVEVAVTCQHDSAFHHSVATVRDGYPASSVKLKRRIMAISMYNLLYMLYVKSM